MTAHAALCPSSDIVAAVSRALVAARDRPNPENDAGCSPHKYARMGRNFRAGAWKHLDENDLCQASNKAWGLVAETVKAISAQHGGIIHAHRSIAMVVDELARLAGDAELQRWIRNSFSVARLLHANFYEDGAAVDDVIAGLMLCEELSECLYALFWPEGAAAEG